MWNSHLYLSLYLSSLRSTVVEHTPSALPHPLYLHRLIDDAGAQLHARRAEAFRSAGFAIVALLANGEPIGASGLRQVHEVCLQLRGRAGRHQVPGDPKTGFTHVYGFPGVSCVTVLSV